MLNRKLSIIAAAAFLLSMPLAASASTTRLEGMTLNGDYTSDYTSIYSWPSTITGVGNLVYAELGNQYSYSWDRAMGAVLPNLWDGRYGVWGIHLRETTPVIGQGDTGAGNGGIDPNRNNDQQFDLTWGKKFGTKALGLSFSRSLAKDTYEIPGNTVTYAFDNNGSSTVDGRNIMGFGAGLSFDMNDKTTVDVTGLYQNRTWENSSTGSAVTANKLTDNGGANYLFGVRAAMKCKPNLVVVPVVKLYNFDLSSKRTVGTVSTTVTNKMSGWQAGVAGNWTIGSNDLFVLGATLAQNKLDQNADIFGVVSSYNSSFGSDGPFELDGSKNVVATESIMPQVFMALETQVNSWLTLRMGATKGVMASYKLEGKTVAGKALTVTYKTSPFALNTGAGIKVGSLRFDALLDGEFFLNPIAQLMGSNNAEFDGYTVFEKVSATYTW